VKGDIDGLTESLERLPFGLGNLASAIKGVMFEVGGVNSMVRETAEVTSALDERMKGLRAASDLRKKVEAEHAAKLAEEQAGIEERRRQSRAASAGAAARTIEEEDRTRLLTAGGERDRARIQRDIAMRRMNEEFEGMLRGGSDLSAYTFKVAAERRIRAEFDSRIRDIEKNERRGAGARLDRVGRMQGDWFEGILRNVGRGLAGIGEMGLAKQRHEQLAASTRFMQIDPRAIVRATQQKDSESKNKEQKVKDPAAVALLQQMAGFLRSMATNGVVGVLGP
jgi:hypothetical protein